MLNEIERAQAASYGWLVCEVYDTKTARVSVKVLPTPNNAVKNWVDLLRVVVTRAQNNDALAKRVLQLVMAGADISVPAGKKTTRKKK